MRSSTPSLVALALAGSGAFIGGSDPSPVGSELVGASASSDDGATEDGSSGAPPAPDACADACLDLGTPQGDALCHSCRCKVAFDDWLPSVDQLQCSQTEPIVTYHAELLETGYALEPTAPGATHCANPSLLTGSCRQGSRLGQLTHGDVSMYWICRDRYLDYDGTVLYHDMAVIGHNGRTGATCFWDDINDVMHDDDAPPLDLLEATEQQRARSIEQFPYNDGSRCINCHDHDPFVYTPYLQSTSWQSTAADKGPYHVVGLDGSARSTEVMELVSPQASPCTSCHRIGSNQSCDFFVPDALAADKASLYEPQVHAAAEPGSPYWRLAYWMPGTTHAFDDFAQWESTYGEAREHILRCCETPGVDGNGCQWRPVPVQ
ncbi:MAG: hypothetical protein AB1Z98_34335 [Nannocystaceae bacterium]